MRRLDIALMSVCSVIVSPSSKNPVKAVDDFFIDVSFMRTEPACEGFRDVQELVDYGFLLFFFRKLVIAFGNYFDHVGRWEIQRLLPHFAKPVDAGDSTPGS